MTQATQTQQASIRMTIGEFELSARLEEQLAPRTCAAFRALLPLTKKLLHARWCGEATWIPFGEYDFGVGYENATSHPAPGQVLLYTGGASETEILVPYGGAQFASKVGPLAGNHFLTVVDGIEHLARIGERALWEGAQEIALEVA